MTMRTAHGVGLAAPQIGEPLRLAVVEVDERLIRAGQPGGRPDRASRPSTGRAACRSRTASPRSSGPPRCVVAADDIEGRQVRHRGRACWLGRFLHEIDHLAGRLYVDLVDPSEIVDTREHPVHPPDRSRVTPGGPGSGRRIRGAGATTGSVIASPVRTGVRHPVGMCGFDRAWLPGNASRGCCSGLVNQAAKRSTWQPPVDSRPRCLGSKVSVEATSASRVVEASRSEAAIRTSVA